MFETVEMVRLIAAGSRSDLDDALRVCADLGVVHIEEHSADTEGVGIGSPNPDADGVTSLLARTRAVVAALKSVNREGPLNQAAVVKALDNNFENDVDAILKVVDDSRESEAEVNRLEEKVAILSMIAPLGLPLDLLTSIESVEVYIAECARVNKVKTVFAELKDAIEMRISGNIIAIACESGRSAEVQMALGELGSKPIQVPTGKGSTEDVLRDAKKRISELTTSIESNGKKTTDWSEKHGRLLLAVNEHLEREEEILTGHVKCAVTSHAYAFEAWVPRKDAEGTIASLKNVSSHVSIRKYVESHGHGHDDEDIPEAKPPVEFKNPALAKPFQSLTELVGRPAYSTTDPTFMMMVTFPIFYGMMLGDVGYGLVLLALALTLRLKIGHTPFGATASTILTWMAAWTMIWGVLYAEAFGFIIDEWGPMAGFYHWTHDSFHVPAFFAETLNMNHTYIPFHRVGGALVDYVLLSIYLGATHLVLGFSIGFINVFRAHGFAAAFFEKGSWLMILFGGFGHIFRYMTDTSYGLFDLTGWSITILLGIACLIVGLAVFEKFGWVGGLIMGPIETFGLLANTLSYLRIMAVGVAGVKIAELGNELGYHTMVTTGSPFVMAAAFVLWVSVHVFAILLGILSPSIHAARLHFVEWMSKFHDGSGAAFSPLGGRPLHVEGHI
jgi:V/A-type H+-transporting ATPase subunit I